MTKPDLTGDRKLHKVGFYKLSGKVLGKGNFARVEEGIHTVLNTKVAIKVLDTSKIKEKYVAKHLDREARMLAKLEHPSIMCLYETMRAGSMYYLVTELATGGDLCTYIKRHKVGRLDERCARRYGRQIISALAHMHKRGIVHRDLKMENIMLDSSRENVKIVDFGLSNSCENGNLLQTHCGSPEYAAPELFIVGKSYGPEVDLWSLGVVMYGMVTGRLPFISTRDDGVPSSDRRRHLLLQINRGLTQQQRKQLCDKTPEFRNMVQRLLTPNIANRITMSELLYHPWVTNHQKKSVPDVVPVLIAPPEHASMVNRIADIMGIPEAVVESEVTINKYGSLGGMYNIMAHVQRLVHTEMNGIQWANSLHGRSLSSSCNSGQSIITMTKNTLGYPSPRTTSAMRPRTSPANCIPPPKIKQKSLKPRNDWIEEDRKHCYKSMQLTHPLIHPKSQPCNTAEADSSYHQSKCKSSTQPNKDQPTTSCNGILVSKRNSSTKTSDKYRKVDTPIEANFKNISIRSNQFESSPGSNTQNKCYRGTSVQGNHSEEQNTYGNRNHEMKKQQDLKKQIEMERQCIIPAEVRKLASGLHLNRTLNYLIDVRSCSSKNEMNKEVLRRIKDLQFMGMPVSAKSAGQLPPHNRHHPVTPHNSMQQ